MNRMIFLVNLIISYLAHQWKDKDLSIKEVDIHATTGNKSPI